MTAGLSLIAPARLILAPSDGPAAVLFVSWRDEEGILQVERRVARRTGEEYREELVFPGAYSIVTDWGRDRVPTIISQVSLAPGARAAVARSPEEGRRTVVLAEARESLKPLVKAEIVVAERAQDIEVLLTGVLSERAGPSGPDGLLDLGVVPNGVRRLAVRAPDRRRATFEIGGSEVAGTSVLPVRLPLLQNLRLDVVLDASREFREANLEAVLETGGVPGAATGQEKRDSRTIRRITISPNDGATLERVPPGQYRVRLLLMGSTVWQEDVTVSDRAEDPDTQAVAARVIEWSVSGFTVLATGEPVVAAVSVGGVRGGFLQLGETTSDTEGRFLLRVLAPYGLSVSLLAISSAPPGMGAAQGTFRVGEALTEPVRIEVRTTGLRVTTVDLRNDSPLEGCTVTVAMSDAEGGQTQLQKTDRDGAAQFTGLREGEAHVLPMCGGYSAGEAVAVALKEGTLQELRVPVAPIERLVLRARVGELPVAGAEVFLPEPLSGRTRESGFYVPARSLGRTDAAGELPIPDGQGGGQVAFVVGTGFGLGVVRLPTTCGDDSVCQAIVEMPPVRLYQRLGVRSPRGDFLSPAWVGVLVQSVALPPNVLSALQAVNGRPHGSLFIEDSGHVWSTLPELLGPGIHEAVYILKSRGMPSGLLLGRFSVPSTEPIVFTADVPGDQGRP